MLTPEVHVRIIAELREHAAVIHMMTVYDDVVADAHDAGFVDIGDAVIAPCLFKAVLQVVVRVIRRLHDRIVDICPVNGDPPDKVLILLKQSAVLLMSQFGLLRTDLFFSQFSRLICF